MDGESGRTEEVAVHSSIHELDRREWDALAGDNVSASHGWLATLEDTSAGRFQTAYLEVRGISARSRRDHTGRSEGRPAPSQPESEARHRHRDPRRSRAARSSPPRADGRQRARVAQSPALRLFGGILHRRQAEARRRRGRVRRLQARPHHRRLPTPQARKHGLSPHGRRRSRRDGKRLHLLQHRPLPADRRRRGSGRVFRVASDARPDAISTAADERFCSSGMGSSDSVIEVSPRPLRASPRPRAAPR
jgi:hypothetical protein